MTYIKLRQSHAAEYFDASSICVVFQTDVSCSCDCVQFTSQTVSCSEPSPPRDKQDLEQKYGESSDRVEVLSTLNTGN